MKGLPQLPPDKSTRVSIFVTNPDVVRRDLITSELRLDLTPYNGSCLAAMDLHALTQTGNL